MTITGILLASAGAYGLYKLYDATSAQRVSNHMNIIIRSRVHKVNLSGLELHTDIKLQNPTKSTLRITQPFIRLLSNNFVLASSKIQNSEFNLQGLSSIDLNTVKMNIDWMNLITLLSSVNFKFPADTTLAQKILYLVQNFKSVIAQLNLEVEYSTYANGIFFSDKEKITL